MPFDRRRYPPDWRAISARIRERSGGRCEGPNDRPLEDQDHRCQARQGRRHPRTGSKVVLTVAHLNHAPLDCRDENLRANCQACHLAWDRPRHVRNAARRRRERKATGDLFQGPYERHP